MNLTERARENLISTYLAQAKAVPEAEVVVGDAFSYSRSELPLSLCNFAIDFHFSSDASERASQVAQLKSITAQRRNFRAFGVTGDGPWDTWDALKTGGFRKHGRLSLMAYQQPARDELPMIRADEPGLRAEVAGFMVHCFFLRREVSLRARVIRTTAESPHELYGYWSGSQLMAAMMISRSPHALGIYNLCVAPRYRRRRLGRSCLETAVKLANDAGLPLTLQSDPGLQGWYEHFGFESCGQVESFSPIGEIL